jgi:hypothetical protein
MKGATVATVSRRRSIKRKRRRRSKGVRNSVGIHHETESVSFAYLSEDKIINESLFCSLVE